MDLREFFKTFGELDDDTTVTVNGVRIAGFLLGIGDDGKVQSVDITTK